MRQKGDRYEGEATQHDGFSSLPSVTVAGSISMINYKVYMLPERTRSAA